MTTQKQQVPHGTEARDADVRRSGERAARRLCFRIEALEQRITPDVVWEDGEVDWTPPPPDPPPPGGPP